MKHNTRPEDLFPLEIRAKHSGMLRLVQTKPLEAPRPAIVNVSPFAAYRTAVGFLDVVRPLHRRIINPGVSAIDTLFFFFFLLSLRQGHTTHNYQSNIKMTAEPIGIGQLLRRAFSPGDIPNICCFPLKIVWESRNGFPEPGISVIDRKAYPSRP